MTSEARSDDQREIFMNQEEFDSRYGFDVAGRNKTSVADKCCAVVKNVLCTCDRRTFRERFFRLFPVLVWFPKYKWREYGLTDLIAGFTVGIVQIPQGMAYGDLAGLDPVHGLYTSFFPSLFYIWMGTSRHISLGAFAIVCMMIDDTLNRFAAKTSYLPYTKASSFIPVSDTTASNYLLTGYDTVDTDMLNITATIPLSPIDVASSLCLLVGFIQLAFGLLNFGFISSCLSDQVISGFTTGAAVHVFAAQVDDVMGVKIKRYQGFGKIFFVTRDLITSAKHANLCTVIISVCSIIALYITKQYMTPPFKRRFRMPIPIDLIVVIIGTIASTYGNYNETYNVDIVAHIPRGLPIPSVPRFDIMTSLISDALSISLIVFTVSVSMGRIFAKRHNYRINANQEFLALGFMECGTSFFHCFPSSGSLGRSIVFEGAGAKSQIAALVSCSLILSVLLWFAPYFQHLPKCILASIIIVALKGFFTHFNDLIVIWPRSKMDSALWLISFFAVLIFDVTAGLCISIAVALFSLILRSQWPKFSLLGRIPETSSFVDVDCYRSAESVEGVRIFQFNASLHFANVRLFEERFFAACGIDLQEAKIWRQNHSSSSAEAATTFDDEEQQTSLSSSDNSSSDQNFDKAPATSKCVVNNAYKCLVPPNYPHHVIIDCSCVNFIDTMGVHLLEQLFSDLEEIGVQLYLSGCTSYYLLRTLEKHKFYEKMPKNCIFPTVYDAVCAATPV